MASGIVEHIVGPDGEIVEIIVHAPIAEMKLAAEAANQAPPSAEEISEVAMRVAQEEHDEASKQKLAASTIATIALALAHLILTDQVHVAKVRVGGRIGGDMREIRIPREIIARVTDGKLGISETADHDVILRWRERADRPIEPEEMRLDA